jgi:hypothetical protein
VEESSQLATSQGVEKRSAASKPRSMKRKNIDLDLNIFPEHAIEMR